MGRIKRSDAFYITLQEDCLPITWISSSDPVTIEGSGAIGIGGFAKLNEQHREIHNLIPRFSPGSIASQELEISRRREAEDVLVLATRTAGSQNRTISADETDIGTFTNTYQALPLPITATIATPIKCSGAGPVVPTTPAHSIASVQVRLDLNIVNGDPGDWEHKLLVVINESVQRFIFTKPLVIRDSRFLRFSTLTNGVDFTNSQISGTPTFCEPDLNSALRDSGTKNELVVNDSSIPKEIGVPLDPTDFNFFDKGISRDDADPVSCSMTNDFETEMREYWLLEPETQVLKDSFDITTPNNALFDDITSVGNIVEATPGLTETIFGVYRTFKGKINSFSWTSTSFVLGIATGPTVRMTQQFGVDLTETTNTIQFSKGRKLFAGNGGADLVGF